MLIAGCTKVNEEIFTLEEVTHRQLSYDLAGLKNPRSSDITIASDARVDRVLTAQTRNPKNP